MKITLPIWDAVYDKWVCVDAELIDVAPHLEGTFAVHEAIVRSRKRGFWAVSHVETGLSVSGPHAYDKRSWAVEATKELLRAKTDADVEERFAKLHERHL